MIDRGNWRDLISGNWQYSPVEQQDSRVISFGFAYLGSGTVREKLLILSEKLVENKSVLFD